MCESYNGTRGRETQKGAFAGTGYMPPGYPALELLCRQGLCCHRAAIEIEGRGAQGIGAEGADMVVLQAAEDFHFGMAVGVVVGDGDDRMPDGTLTERTKGTPQGGPISPLLANLFLHVRHEC